MARRTRAQTTTTAAKPASRETWLDRASAWLVPCAVLVVTGLTFLPALQGQFLTWDDDVNFLLNPSYRGLGAAELRWMFTTFHFGPYQPLSWMTLGLDYVLWGMNPFGYHLTSLVIHLANAWLVYVLAIRVFLPYVARTEGRSALRADAALHADTPTRIAAGVAALLFAIHPLRVESVAWVTERRDVLSGFFALLTMLAYLGAADRMRTGRRSGAWLAASVALFALSLLSKASAMMLPVALIAIDLRLLRRTEPGPENPHPATVPGLLVEKIPFAALGIVAAVLAAVGQRTSVTVLATLDRDGALPRIARAFYGLAFYLWKSIVPLDLTHLYEVPFRANGLDVHFLASAAAVVAITTATVLLRRRAPGLFVAWMAYLLLLLPVSGIAHGDAQIVADRYSYLPCLSLALLAAGSLLSVWRSRQAGRIGRSSARFVAVGTAAILIALAVITSAQTRVWHDSTTLWQHAFDDHPIERLRRGGPGLDAERLAYEATLRSLGNMSAYWAICYNLGTALRADGHLVDALGVYALGAGVNPANANIRESWAAALMDLRRYDEAAQQLESAIALEPGHALAYYNLGLVRTAQDRSGDAIAAYRRSIALDAGRAEAHYNLGVLLAAEGQLEYAADEYHRAIALRPGYAEAYNNLGVALGRQGRTREAVDAFRHAVALDPGNEFARQNLARALAFLNGGR